MGDLLRIFVSLAVIILVIAVGFTIHPLAGWLAVVLVLIVLHKIFTH